MERAQIMVSLCKLKSVLIYAQIAKSVILPLQCLRPIKHNTLVQTKKTRGANIAITGRLALESGAALVLVNSRPDASLDVRDLDVANGGLAFASIPDAQLQDGSKIDKVRGYRAHPADDDESRTQRSGGCSDTSRPKEAESPN